MPGYNKYRSRRKAIIEFTSQKGADRAIEYMNGGIINGGNVVVKLYSSIETNERERSREAEKKNNNIKVGDQANALKQRNAAKPTTEDAKGLKSNSKIVNAKQEQQV